MRKPDREYRKGNNRWKADAASSGDGSCEGLPSGYFHQRSIGLPVQNAEESCVRMHE